MKIKDMPECPYCGSKKLIKFYRTKVSAKGENTSIERNLKGVFCCQCKSIVYGSVFFG